MTIDKLTLPSKDNAVQLKINEIIDGYATETYVDTGLATKQDVLNAGSGISISTGGSVIPLTQTLPYTFNEVRTDVIFVSAATFDQTKERVVILEVPIDTSYVTFWMTGWGGRYGICIENTALTDIYVSDGSSFEKFNITSFPVSGSHNYLKFVIDTDNKTDIYYSYDNSTWTLLLSKTRSNQRTETWANGVNICNDETTGWSLDYLYVAYAGESRISCDNTIARVSDIPTNNNQLTNGAGYITGITSGDVTTALGYTPYNSTNPDGYITSSALTGYVTSTDLSTTLADYTLSSNLATVATTGSYDDLTNKPYIPSGVVVDQTYDATSQNAQSGVAIAGAGFLTGITSGMVTTALGYTPYNSTNPDGYITASDLPTNYMTTNTAQDVSGRKTFLGEKAIYFKQSSTTDKLGFTLYNTSNSELAALEWRPNTVNGNALLALNCPQAGSNYVGFRYWANINIVAPRPAVNGTYFIPVNITNGSTTVTATSTGTVNISSLMPTVNNATLTIQKNGTTVNTFTANASSNVTCNITVPTKVSDLTNDSGYTTNVGTVTKVNNTSPDSNGNVTISIPSAVTETTVSGWGFTKNTGTVTSVNNVSPVNGNVSLTIPDAQVNADWNATSGKAQILNKPTIPTISDTYSATSSNGMSGKAVSSAISGKANSATSLSGYGITDAYTKTEINGMVSAGMHYKGTKASVSALPSTENVIGDLWNVSDTGANYAWNGTNWDKLSENIDLSGYVPTSRTVNGKALTSNISLTASDVGALPSSTSIPTKTSDLTNDDGFITGITGSDVTTALGYTPYNATNPNGYITSSALNGYAKTADLATVATSGSYNDLSNKPTIPAAQVQSDWNVTNTSSMAYIKNKPTIPSVPLEGVQINGSDLTITNKKVNIPVAGASILGVGMANTAYGVYNYNNYLAVSKATDALVTAKANNFRPLVPSNIDLAVKTGITTNTLTLTDAEKATARSWLGSQAELVSGTNIKTVNNTSLLGSGNIDTSEIFVAEQGITTYQKVLDAYNAGKTIICVKTQDYPIFKEVYFLTRFNWQTTQDFIFSRIINNTINTVILDTNDTWTTSSVNLANTDLSNLSTTGQAVIDNSIKSILELIYPVGAIFIGTTSTCPMAQFFGTWSLVAADRVLQGSSSNHAANSTISAGLPNITGNISSTTNQMKGSTDPSASGALSINQGSVNSSGYNSASGNSISKISFSAENSNSIYGSSSTVQPPAYVVNVWRRTA